MMNKQTEALKMAIEALERVDRWLQERHMGNLTPLEKDALQACKEALEQPAKNIRDSFNEMLEDKVAYYKGKQPAQEPVAWECFSDPAYYDMWAIRQVGNRNFEETIHVVNGKEAKQLCAWLNSLNIHTCVLTHSAPSFIGLSDDEIDSLLLENPSTHIEFGRAIEQALKEKNT